jgi:serine/threonine-protein kinase HipA
MRDKKEAQKAFARAVFNVLFHNGDDHPKNFAWRLGQDHRWQLAPAFDLTFNEGPMGQHNRDICGQATEIERPHLLRLAKEGGYPPFLPTRQPIACSIKRQGTKNVPANFRSIN